MEKNEISYFDKIPRNVNLIVKENETLHLEMASFSLLGEININIDILKNGIAEIGFADFSHDDGKIIFNANLLGEGATLNWNLASLSMNQEKKQFAPSVYHKAPHTRATVKNYGIARDSSSLFFLGESSIPRGSKKSYTRQEAKIIVFDEGCKGKASPVLKISENDVEASHGAAVGRLNENHLFYLMSRGLTLEEAKRLITLGYLKPIESCFHDEAIRLRIDQAIEGGI